MHDEPGAPDAILALAKAQISFRTKAGHLALLIISMAAVIALGSLLLTERLPDRSFVALAALALLNLVWAGYASWVLTTRRTMLLHHRVIAGRIAVLASALFTLGSAGLGIVSSQPAAYVAAMIGLVFTGIAAVLLTHANRQHSVLKLRRAELTANLQRAEL